MSTERSTSTDRTTGSVTADAPVLHTPGCVNMGNPHVVFFTADAETAPVAEVSGP